MCNSKNGDGCTGDANNNGCGLDAGCNHDYNVGSNVGCCDKKECEGGENDMLMMNGTGMVTIMIMYGGTRKEDESVIMSDNNDDNDNFGGFKGSGFGNEDI